MTKTSRYVAPLLAAITLDGTGAEVIGCELKLTLKNGGPDTVTLVQGGALTAVKKKGSGAWLPVVFPNATGGPATALARNSAVFTTYKAPFGCDEARRVRVSYMCPTGVSKTEQFPSETGWTHKNPLYLTLAGC